MIYSKEYTRTYLLQADSENEMNVWIKVLRHNIRGDSSSIPSAKCLLFGTPACGKTALISRWSEGVFQTEYKQTETICHTLIKSTNEDYQLCYLECFDIPGDSNFDTIPLSVFHDSKCIICIFDVSDRSSFDKIQSFYIPKIREVISPLLTQSQFTITNVMEDSNSVVSNTLLRTTRKKRSISILVPKKSQVSTNHSKQTSAVPSTTSIPIIVIGTKIDLERKVSKWEAICFATKEKVEYMETTAALDQHSDDTFHLIVDILSRRGLFPVNTNDDEDVEEQILDEEEPKKGSEELHIQELVPRFELNM